MTIGELERLHQATREHFKGTPWREDVLDDVFLLARWALLHARPALEWERDRCGMLSGPLKEALAAFPSETI